MYKYLFLYRQDAYNLGDKVTRKEFAVIDFGSSKIVLLVGFKAKDGIHVLTKCEQEYDGFMEGEFLNSEKLSEPVSSCVLSAEKAISKRITKLYVGIPDEWVVPVLAEGQLKLNKQVRIKEKHLQQVLENINLSAIPDTHEVVSVSPVSYSLDGGHALLTITKESASRIDVWASVIACEKSFISLMDSIFQDVGIADIEYLPTCLATATMMIDKKAQDGGAILIDVGNVTTSIASVFNGCVVELMTFASGGGLINMDLMSMLKISYFEAEQLKRKTVLSMEATSEDYYEIFRDNKLVKFYSQTVNDIVKARVESMAGHMLSCLEKFSSDITHETMIYLTGGGLSYLVGATEIVSQILGKQIKLISSNELQYFRPDYTSSMGLLKMVIDIAG